MLELSIHQKSSCVKDKEGNLLKKRWMFSNWEVAEEENWKNDRISSMLKLTKHLAN